MPRSLARTGFAVLGCLAGLLVFVPRAWGAPPEPARLALVIGNGDYQNLPAVRPAAPDARLVGATLGELGFETVVRTNLSQAEMRAARDQFLKAATQGQVVLVYFAGYSIPFQGDNFLLPVGFDPAKPEQWDDASRMSQQALSLASLLERLDQAQPGLKIVVVDGSRSAPALERHGVGFSGDIERKPDSFLLVSAEPDRTFVDPPGIGPSAFARAFCDVIRRPGLTLAQVLEQVQQKVYADSSGAQAPVAPLLFVTHPFFFRAPVVEAAKPAPSAVASSAVFAPGAMAMNKDREEYVLIPAGKFLMGCVPASEAQCEPQEKPQHAVEIAQAFWLGRNEVQVDKYRNFANLTGRKMPAAPQGNSRWRNSNHPMVMVSWQDAAAYCTWAGGRLPTEAEWEYAYRARGENQVFPLNDENSRDKANFYGKKGNDQYDETAPVRSFDPSAFGLFDMAGNVWEWVQDYYATGYSPGAVKDPQGPASGAEHVIRGGSFASDPKKHLRLSYRKAAEKPGNNIGFRCALPDTPETRAQFR